MKKIVEKLNYKGQKRIALLNSDESFALAIFEELKGVTVDSEIDPRYPYGFIILFVKNVKEVNLLTPIVVHNLIADGTLWYCFPKKSSKKYKSDLDRDHGWKILHDSGLNGIRMISIDENWSAFRFRNTKYIKSTRQKINGTI